MVSYEKKQWKPFYLKKSFNDDLHFLFIPMIFLVGLDDQVQVSSPDVLLQHGLDVVPEVAVLARKPFTSEFKLGLLLLLAIRHYCLKIAQTCDTCTNLN
jgi:hypothetical protein